MDLEEVARRRSENLAVMSTEAYIRGERVFFRLKEQLEKVFTLTELGRVEAQREEFFGRIKRENPELYVSFRVPDEVLIRKMREKMSKFQDRIMLN
jgi:hypothetical protein